MTLQSMSEASSSHQATGSSNSLWSHVGDISGNVSTSTACSHAEPVKNSVGDSCTIEDALSTAAALAAASAQVVKEATSQPERDTYTSQQNGLLTVAPVPTSFFPRVIAYQQAPPPLKSQQISQVFQSIKLRRGKWTQEEERFADHLIQEFEKGTVQGCENGCTLRAFLSRKLHCAPMRISKKYAGKGIGKHVFLSRCCSGNHASESASDVDNGTKLRDLEQNFYKSLFHEETAPIVGNNDARLVVWNSSSLTQNPAPVAYGNPQGYSAPFPHLGTPCMPVHTSVYGHPIQIAQPPHFVQFAAQAPMIQLPPQQHQQGIVPCAPAPGVLVPNGHQLAVTGFTPQAPCISLQFSTNQNTQQLLHQAYMDVVNQSSATANTNNGKITPIKEGPSPLVVTSQDACTSDHLEGSPTLESASPILSTNVDILIPASTTISASRNQPSEKTSVVPATSVLSTILEHAGPGPRSVIQPGALSFRMNEGQQRSGHDDQKRGCVGPPLVILSSGKGSRSSAVGQALLPPSNPCCSQATTEVPDFLSGFEKVAARARESRGKPATQFQWIDGSFGLSGDTNTKAQMNNAHEEAHSPYITSKSFDDLHCHLGKGLSSPLADDFDLNSADSYAIFAQQSAHAVSQHSAYARGDQEGDGLPQLTLPSVVLNEATLSENYAAAVGKHVESHPGVINAANLLAHAEAARKNGSYVVDTAFPTQAHDERVHHAYSTQGHHSIVSGSEQSHSYLWTEDGGSIRGSENNMISDNTSNDSDSNSDEGPLHKKIKIEDSKQQLTSAVEGETIECRD